MKQVKFFSFGALGALEAWMWSAAEGTASQPVEVIWRLMTNHATDERVAPGLAT